ncbi:putative holin-like toxin [Paenibacillus dendritiformis]
MYEALFVIFQFGIWIFALLMFVITLLLYLTQRK